MPLAPASGCDHRGPLHAGCPGTDGDASNRASLYARPCSKTRSRGLPLADAPGRRASSLLAAEQHSESGPPSACRTALTAGTRGACPAAGPADPWRRAPAVRSPLCAKAGCHSISSNGTGHLGWGLSALRAGSSTACGAAKGRAMRVCHRRGVTAGAVDRNQQAQRGLQAAVADRRRTPQQWCFEVGASPAMQTAGVLPPPAAARSPASRTPSRSRGSAAGRSTRSPRRAGRRRARPAAL